MPGPIELEMRERGKAVAARLGVNSASQGKHAAGKVEMGTIE
jgi:hypothetical protein